MRLASFVSVFVAATLSVVYFFHINYKTLVIIKKKEEILKTNSLRARKTPEASFRFFFITVALPVVYFIIRIYKTLFSVIKYEENE